MVRRRSRAVGTAHTVAESIQPARASLMKPTEDEVIAAVLSLYEDELRPFGRILRKRCGERARAAAVSTSAVARSPQALSEDAPAVVRDQKAEGKAGKSKGGAIFDVDPKHVKAICESSTRLWVVEEQGAEWSALLPTQDPEDDFVDIYDTRDPFPDEFWLVAAEYFESLEGDAMVLPGGRYACAQTLIQRDARFLSGMSLGRVCHVVQLAMTQRKLLGYLNGDMVPYAHSQSCEKERSAARGDVCTNCMDLPFADWDAARAGLRKLLKAAQSNLLSVSNVKRLFRSEFQIELSETRLGHSKMTTLLLDDRLRDVCHVQLHGHGHAVVQVASSSKSSSAAWSDLSEDPLVSTNIFIDADASVLECENQRFSTARVGGADEFVCDFNAPEAEMVKNTFIHVGTSANSSRLEMSRRRSQSMPKDSGSQIAKCQQASVPDLPAAMSGNSLPPQSPLTTPDAFEVDACTFAWRTEAWSTASTSPPRDQSDSEAHSDRWSDISDSHTEQGESAFGKLHRESTIEASPVKAPRVTLNLSDEIVFDTVPATCSPPMQFLESWLECSYGIGAVHSLTGSWQSHSGVAAHAWLAPENIGTTSTCNSSYPAPAALDPNHMNVPSWGYLQASGPH